MTRILQKNYQGTTGKSRDDLKFSGGLFAKLFANAVPFYIKGFEHLQILLPAEDPRNNSPQILLYALGLFLKHTEEKTMENP